MKLLLLYILGILFGGIASAICVIHISAPFWLVICGYFIGFLHVEYLHFLLELFKEERR